MSGPDDQAVADYSRANRAQEGRADRSAEPISGPFDTPGASSRAGRAEGLRGALARRPGSGDSLLGTARVLLLLGGAAGAVALVVADLSTLYEVKVGSVVLARVAGHDQHDFALLLLGLAAVPMLLGALRGALPAMLAVAAIGLAATIAGPIGDRNDVRSAGSIGDYYAGASANAASGYRSETAGAVLLLLSGGGLTLLEARGGRRLPRRRRSRDSAEPAHGPGIPDNPYAESSADQS
jgi:hypothetical protein